MRKLLSFVLMCCALLTLGGCSPSSKLPDNELIKEKADEILSCINERNTNGIKEMISKDVSDEVNLDTQIENCYDIINGKLTSEYSWSLGHSSEYVDEGKITERYVSAYVYASTDIGEKYTIYFTYYYILAKKPSMQGVYRISITTETGEEYLIGKHISIEDTK